MTHTVAVGEFEGPLGILLDLVERRQFEVTSISVADITTGYLESIRSLKARSAEELSEFLALGARLLYIKSLALLPTTNPAEQTEELRTLNLELDEYKRIRQAARTLGLRAANRSWVRPVAPQLELHELPLPDLELSALTQAFARALRAAPVEAPSGIIHVTISQHMVQTRLRHRLAAGFELAEVLRECANRLEIVVTFLALLELVREGAASVGQADQFGDIEVHQA